MLCASKQALLTRTAFSSFSQQQSVIERAAYEEQLRQSDKKNENNDDNEDLHHKVTVLCSIPHVRMSASCDAIA